MLMLRHARCYPVLNVRGGHSTFCMITKLYVSSRPLLIEERDTSDRCILNIIVFKQSSLELSGRYLKRIDLDELPKSQKRIRNQISLLQLTSFFLSTIRKPPFLSTIAISPVFSHPSLVIVSFVACSLLKYPIQTLGARIKISPGMS